MKKKVTKENNTTLIKSGWMVSAREVMIIYTAIVLAFVAGACHVLAAGDPISTVNKLSDFIFSLIRAIGLILLGLGIMHSYIRVDRIAASELPLIEGENGFNVKYN